MSIDKRHKDKNWALPTSADGRIQSWEAVQIAVLMDIRDDLKALGSQMRQLNSLLHCPNFIAIPRKLDAINRKLPARKKRRVST